MNGDGVAVGLSIHGVVPEETTEMVPGLESGWQSWGCSPGEEKAAGRAQSPLQVLKELISKEMCDFLFQKIAIIEGEIVLN